MFISGVLGRITYRDRFNGSSDCRNAWLTSLEQIVKFGMQFIARISLDEDLSIVGASLTTLGFSGSEWPIIASLVLYLGLPFVIVKIMRAFVHWSVVTKRTPTLNELDDSSSHVESRIQTCAELNKMLQRRNKKRDFEIGSVIIPNKFLMQTISELREVKASVRK